jgi:hypothetical protein
MASNASGMQDRHTSRNRTKRGNGHRFSLQGSFSYRLKGPDGTIKQEGSGHNLVTDYGDEWAASRTAGVSAEDAVTGMRLGTGDTAPAKNGAGAAIVTYISGSAKVLDATYPQTSDKGAGQGYRATYVVTWGAGEATEDGIVECAVTNATIADVAGTAGNTVARFLLSPVVNKGVNDELEVTWHNDYQGS